MAGVTDRTFRKICRECGAEYTVSEMISAKALCYEQRSKRSGGAPSATVTLAQISPSERPIAIQLFGRDPEYMAEAARLIESREYRGCLATDAPAAIDINMGCPVRKVTANGEGSALMREPEVAAEVVRAVTRAVSLPVTVKIRAGWDENSVNAPEFAARMEDAGASMIVLHARTRARLYMPGIDLGVIEKTKKRLSIPLVGNGDIYSASDAMRMREETGCDGVMIGRGAMGNPWLFSQIRAEIDGEEIVLPDHKTRLAMALRHLDETILHKGERVGTAEAKKHVAWYLHGMDGAAVARDRVMSSQSSGQIREIISSLW